MHARARALVTEVRDRTEMDGGRLPEDDPNRGKADGNAHGSDPAAGRDAREGAAARHEVFGDPTAGAAALLVLVAQLIAYAFAERCTC